MRGKHHGGDDGLALCRFPVAELLLPGGSGAGPMLAHLREHGWAVLQDTAQGVELSTDVAAACAAFFGEEDEAKKRHTQPCPGKIGKLHMWGAGYSRQRVREQFHVVVVSGRNRQTLSSFNAALLAVVPLLSVAMTRSVTPTIHVLSGIPLPPTSQGAEEQCGWGERHELRELVNRHTQHLSHVCRMCVDAVGRGVLRQCEDLEAEHGDPSVVDIFQYFNVLREGRPEGNMGSHFDPGLLTLKPVSPVPGLDVLDAGSGRWIDLEAVATPMQDLLIFSGETLEALTEGEFKATSHRVHTEGHERLSIVYEMRSHHTA